MKWVSREIWKLSKGDVCDVEGRMRERYEIGKVKIRYIRRKQRILKNKNNISIWMNKKNRKL